ncbi:MAG: hypothetical protein GVY28_09225, partial [Alphaproteobacteria bacterium]|nr:hypothetical protein [Alphaproteobacteria bacterium]
MTGARGGGRDAAIAAIAGLIVALVMLAAGAVLLRAAERESLASLAAATEASVEAIGRSVADLIETGLGYDIPLDALYGVENHFNGIVAAMPTVDALALERADGTVLVATAPSVSGKRFPVHRDGAVVGSVVLE